MSDAARQNLAVNGHVFVVRGDLTRIACDAWLVPTDAGLTVEKPWRKALGGAPERPPGWGHGVRAAPLRVDSDRPRPWLVDVGAHAGTAVNWFMDGVREFIAGASREALSAAPRTGRARPLLAVPVVGTGRGGAADHKGDITLALVEALLEAVRRHQVDVVIVTWHDRAFAAAQSARRTLVASAGDDVSALWPSLDPSLVEEARALAAEARRRRLVLFLGAGIGAGAGLPQWDALLDGLAEDALLGDRERELLKKLHPLDRARLIEGRLRGSGSSLGASVCRRLEGRLPALAHALLASLPVTEAATTNYDTLFEEARRDAGRPLAVLPYESTNADAGWLLKMHGSVEHPDDIVLTREDYLRYAERRAALAGIVQALLITRHMLFVGFSLSDDNFHRIAHDVRNAVRTGGASRPQFGTALLLRPEPMLEELWQADLHCVPIDREGSQNPEAGRRLDMFLDLLAFEASTNTAHLLAEEYDGVLSDDERSLRELVRGIERDAGVSARRAPAWAEVERLLDALGGGSSGR